MKKCLLLILSVLIACTAARIFFPSCVSAANNSSITLVCEEGERCEGIEWNLYLAGLPDSKGVMETVGDFSILEFPDVTVENLEFGRYAGVLADYIAEKNLRPLMTAYGDKNGVTVFSGLSKGFYVAVPEVCVNNKRYYVYMPTAVYAEDSNNPDKKDVLVYPKLHSSGDYDIDKKYELIRFDRSDWWDNYVKIEFKTEPVITVTEPYTSETDKVTKVTTPDESYASGTEKLTTSSDINASETETVTTAGDSYASETVSVTTVSEPYTSETATSVGENTVTKISSEPNKETMITTEEKIPQTGQLWLPVPILSVCGMLLAALGYILKNDSQ